MVEKKGPFGGFCNYGIFGIWGKDPETGKKKYKKVEAVSEAAAVEKAAALGCVDPQSVEVIPFLPPSEKQQRYAADLGVRLPEGCTVVDATALISRVEIGDDQDPAPGLVEYAQSCGVCFLRWPERVVCSTVWSASFRSGRKRSFSPMRLLPVFPDPLWRILEKIRSI